MSADLAPVPGALRRLGAGWLLLLALGGCNAKPTRTATDPAEPPLRQLEVPGREAHSKDPSCLRNKGGCGEAPSFPRCSPTLTVVPLATVLQNPSAYVYQGPRYEEVAVSGNLLRRSAGAACTLAYCDPGTCCNRCSSDLTLQDLRVPDARVELSPREFSGFQCNGDESLICCPPPQQRYVVRGMLLVLQDCPKGMPCERIFAMNDAEVCSP